MTEQKQLYDKSSWPDGPWKDEPDRVFWIDKKTGYPCIALRQGIGGHFCGYVAVGENHFLYEKSYWNEDLFGDGTSLCDIVDVHGGLTYSNPCTEKEKDRVCHDSPDKAWWFGFDCMHVGDVRPTDSHLYDIKNDLKYYCGNNLNYPDVYRDLNFVKSECTKLASFLKKIGDEYGTKTMDNR